jgi:hypothetical protein
MNNTSKLIEELKAELAIAEQKLYEEKQAVLKAEREAEYAAKEAACKEREATEMFKWETVAKEIVIELKKVGFTEATYSLPDSGRFPNVYCFPDDKYVAWGINFEVSYNRDSWRARENGVVVMVGQYGEKNRYPQSKTGGFNYSKIATTAWDKYQTSIAKQKRANTAEENKTSNEARITRLNNQFGKPVYEGADRKEIKNVSIHHYTFYNRGTHGGECTYRQDNNLKLHVDSITEENAAKLIQFMLDNGMIAQEK